MALRIPVCLATAMRGEASPVRMSLADRGTCP